MSVPAFNLPQWKPLASSFPKDYHSFFTTFFCRYLIFCGRCPLDRAFVFAVQFHPHADWKDHHHLLQNSSYQVMPTSFSFRKSRISQNDMRGAIRQLLGLCFHLIRTFIGSPSIKISCRNPNTDFLHSIKPSVIAMPNPFKQAQRTGVLGSAKLCSRCCCTPEELHMDHRFHR